MAALLETLKGRLRRLTAKDQATVATQAAAYLAGDLSAEEVRLLNERLRHDRAARREFARVLLKTVHSGADQSRGWLVMSSTTTTGASWPTTKRDYRPQLARTIQRATIVE